MTSERWNLYLQDGKDLPDLCLIDTQNNQVDQNGNWLPNFHPDTGPLIDPTMLDATGQATGALTAAQSTDEAAALLDGVSMPLPQLDPYMVKLDEIKTLYACSYPLYQGGTDSDAD